MTATVDPANPVTATPVQAPLFVQSGRPTQAATPEPTAPPEPPKPSQKAPPPAPPVQAKTKPTGTADAVARLEALEKSLNAKLEAVDSQAATYQAQIEKQAVLNSRAVAQSRVEHLRQIGISDVFTDQQILSLSPEADPSTVEGKAALDSFRTKNEGLFIKPEGGPALSIEDAAARFKGNKMFTPEKYAANLKEILSKR